MIKELSLNELCRMTDREGLVIQGCGGDLNEWVSGITTMLRENGALPETSDFKEIYKFEHDGLCNLMFMIDNTKIEIGKLAIWRINTHSLFGGTWLSDYQPNYLGVDRTASECNEIE